MKAVYKAWRRGWALTLPERPSELRLLALNATLRTLTLQGNPVAKKPEYRASVGSTLPALLR